MALITERLIECVKRYPVLYDFYHPDYKNLRKRDRMWARIGLELKESGNEVKKKWKNIRDTYLKYLKSSKSKSSSNKKYYNWQWATRMEFFRPFMPTPRAEPAPHNVAEHDEEFNDYYIETIKEDVDPIKQDVDDISETKIQIVSAMTAPPISRTSTELSGGHSRSMPSLKNGARQKIVEIPDSKRITDLDATELVFLGYAKTIKTFSIRRRAETKLKIAQLIIQQEMEQQEEMASVQQQH